MLLKISSRDILIKKGTLHACVQRDLWRFCNEQGGTTCRSVFISEGRRKFLREGAECIIHRAVS